jgi:hypothetical protein
MTHKDLKSFYKLIIATKSESKGNLEYGANVMPALKLYKSLRSFEERKSFQDALEQMLQASDAGERRFAVNICLGFFVFRDAI